MTGDVTDNSDNDAMVAYVGKLLERIAALEASNKTLIAWRDDAVLNGKAIKQERDDLADEVSRLRGLLYGCGPLTKGDGQ